jgi:hypothetical protein
MEDNMGKISKCFYREIDPRDCSVEHAAEFYFYSNMMTASEHYMQKYEDYDIIQTKRKDALLGIFMREENLLDKVRTNTATLAISTMKDKVILYADT